MAHDDKLVMQVTIRAQEFPAFYRELRDMTANKQRANVFVRLAYFGWLLERNGVTANVSRPAAAAPSPAGQMVGLQESRSVNDWLVDLVGGDGPDEEQDGTAAA